MTDTTGVALATLERLERLTEQVADVADDLKRLRAELATTRAAADELGESLERILAAPYFSEKAMREAIAGELSRLHSTDRGDMTATR